MTRAAVRWGWAALAVAAVAALVAVRSGALARPVAASPRTAPFVVPHVSARFDLDGELDEAAWLREAARTGPFTDAAGAAAIPFSEARLAWGDDALFVALYAADIDVRTRDAESRDAFEMTIRGGDRLVSIRFDPSGAADATVCRGAGWTCADAPRRWDGALRIGHDVDGTPDDASDDDEEWVIEAALPLRALGVEPRAGAAFALRVRRCDVPRGGQRSCGAWSGARGSELALGGA